MLLVLATALTALFRPPTAVAQTAVVLAGADRQVRGGRFTVVSANHDARLADQLLAAAISTDTFPGLPRPRAQVLLAIAPSASHFRAWIGPYVPEWGAAIAIPSEQRIIMQGQRAGSDAGDPRTVLRHELAHLALHEAMRDLPARWFDEGYASFAAGEWNRESAFETSLGMVWSTLPSRDSLNAGFYGRASRATWSYAVAHRVVAEMDALDPINGLANFFAEWRRTGSFEMGVRSAYGLTGAQFDRHWQAQTRRRYGALALVANLSLVAGIFGLLLGPLFVMRRRRDRRRLDAMRAADAASEKALQESALAALLAETNTEAAGAPEVGADDSVTRVSATADVGLVGGGGRQVSSTDD
ncbi:MAG: hypothetical protein IT353_10795 [Gemmatimonadaceae bacterium]|nr:hypothetical protein [Gemmatimonadaceae bacterium]